MPDRLADVRARARAHQEEIESREWFTIAELAKRWKVSQTTVRLIPLEQLRYKEFGDGKKNKRRRYGDDWVRAFEDN